MVGQGWVGSSRDHDEVEAKTNSLGTMYYAASPMRALAAKSVGMQNEVAFWLFCDAMEDYEELYQFLIFHRYPTGFSKNQKRVLRRRSQDHSGVSMRARA